MDKNWKWREKTKGDISKTVDKPGQSPKWQSLTQYLAEFTEDSPFSMISGEGVIDFTPNQYNVANIRKVTLRSDTFLIQTIPAEAWH